MKKTLFKAKPKDWRERPKEEWWVYGDAIHELIGMTIKHMEHGMPVRVPVDPETLCQYICMNDKNGNWIWENDIVSINTYSYMEPEEDYFGKVVYVEEWGCWCIQQPGEEKPIPLCECEGSYLTERVVEGNIFDNPELLKGDAE